MHLLTFNLKIIHFSFSYANMLRLFALKVKPFPPTFSECSVAAFVYPELTPRGCDEVRMNPACANATYLFFVGRAPLLGHTFFQ
jgi:hypothetical protein